MTLTQIARQCMLTYTEVGRSSWVVAFEMATLVDSMRELFHTKFYQWPSSVCFCGTPHQQLCVTCENQVAYS